VIVEVDPETMMSVIKRYVVAHDCGTVINPMIVVGQIQGRARDRKCIL
jgi:aerobic carbon-monoxide dehydrogenase large subunit